MEKETNKIREELQSLSPVLTELHAQPGGQKIPEGYFDELEPAIFRKIEENGYTRARPEGDGAAAGPRPAIQWVIVGGESGHGARPMAAAWVRALRDQCAALDVPFFFKQWGCHDEAGQPCSKKDGGRRLDGQTHDGWPRGFEPLAVAA